MNKPISIKISGAGPTGTLLAISLARLNCNIDLFDAYSFKDIINRDRSYALTHSSRELLSELLIWNKLREYLIPFSSLIMEDINISKKVIFSIKDLKIKNRESSSIGWVIEHRILMGILYDEMQSYKNICFLENESNSINYDICFDSSGSLINRTKTVTPSYANACITFKVLLRGYYNACAYETFTKEGPLAILPLGQSIYQIVWSAPHSLCQKRISLKPSYFLDTLSQVLPYGLEPDFLIDRPQLFYTGLSISFPLFRAKIFKVGNSAHTIHPVGGQGLNLCIRDISTIYYIISNRNKLYNWIKSVPFAYSLYRYPDIILTSFMTEFLLRFFSNNYSILNPIKASIFRILCISPFARRFFLSLMTDGFPFSRNQLFYKTRL